LQYTGSSFVELITSRFVWLLRPRRQSPRIDTLFPAPSHFHSLVGDSVLDHLILPRVQRLRAAATRLRDYQQGDLQRYVLYIVAAIVTLLLFDLRLDWLLQELWGS
jgi:hypothetical protein